MTRGERQQIQPVHTRPRLRMVRRRLGNFYQVGESVAINAGTDPGSGEMQTAYPTACGWRRYAQELTLTAARSPARARSPGTTRRL